MSYASAEGSSVEFPVGPDTTSYTITSLKPGVIYTVYIWAVKGAKSSKKISTQAETGLLLISLANLTQIYESKISFHETVSPNFPDFLRFYHNKTNLVLYKRLTC